MPASLRPRVRRARGTDLATLVAHRREMWAAIGGFSPAELAAGDPVYARWVRRMRRAHRFFAWIAEDDDGRPIGSGAVWLTEAQPRPGEPGPFRPYILSVYTDPAHRGSGVASTIVRAAVEFAKGRGYRRVTLHASEMGRSVYLRLGFERAWEMRQRFDAPGRSPRRVRSGRRGPR